MFSRIQWRIAFVYTVLVGLISVGLAIYLAIWLQNLDADLRPSDDAIRGVLSAVLVAETVGVAAAIVMAIMVARSTSESLLALRETAEQLGAGEVRPLLYSGRDEVSQLGIAFNRMAHRLRSQIAEAERERTRLAAVLTYMADGLIIADDEGIVHLVNPAAARLLQIEQSWAIGKSLVTVVRDHELASVASRTLTDEDAVPEPRIIELGGRTNGRSVQAMASQVPTIDRAGRQVLLILQDVTELQRLETVRREFVTNVSHELRTPVAGLKALVETLEGGAIDEPEVAREFLGRMQIEVDRLAGLVEDLLDLSRIESGQVPLRMEPIRIDEAVATAVERMLPLAERQGVVLRFAEDSETAIVQADALRMEQVVINLVHNAVKFTPPGGAITVRTQRHDHEVQVRVQDNGVGIAPEALPRLFERFFKADRARASGLGTGLGLAIAKHLVQAHGGRIWAESAGEGAGATFIFALPLAPAP